MSTNIEDIESNLYYDIINKILEKYDHKVNKDTDFKFHGYIVSSNKLKYYFLDNILIFHIWDNILIYQKDYNTNKYYKTNKIFLQNLKDISKLDINLLTEIFNNDLELIINIFDINIKESVPELFLFNTRYIIIQNFNLYIEQYFYGDTHDCCYNLTFITKDNLISNIYEQEKRLRYSKKLLNNIKDNL